MDANVLCLIFLSFLKLGSSFDLAVASSNEQEEGTEFPFMQAKIKYHNSRYCITAFGDTNCVSTQEAPGDAAKIAKLYKIWMQGYQPHPDRVLRTILGVHKNIKMKQLRQGNHTKNNQAVLNHLDNHHKLSQKTKEGKLSQMIKQGKLRHRTDQAKPSTSIKQGKLSQRTDQVKVSHPVKQVKLSQNTKQTKLRHLSKQGNLSQRTKQPKLNQMTKQPKLSQPVKSVGLKENRAIWNVGGHHNHVAPIPRLLDI